MKLLNVRVGARQGIAFAPVSNDGRVPFSFPSPINGAYALVQSFYLHRIAGDMELNTVRVSLETLFNPAHSTTDGEVQVAISFTGSGGPSPFIGTDNINAEIGILVIGV